MVLVLDFDGTLANSWPLIYKCFSEGLKAVNVSLVGKISDYFGPDEKGCFDRMIGDKKIADEAFITYKKTYLKYHEELMPSLAPGAEELIKHFYNKGITIYLLTGRTLDTSLISLGYFGIDQYFKKIYVGSRNGIYKVENFKKLFEEENLKPEDCVYIGDSLEDMNSCKKANVKLFTICHEDHNRHLENLKLNKDSYESLKEIQDKLDSILL